MNAYVERFVQAIQQECLDQFIIFGTEHFDHVCREYVEHYHTERPHQALDNAPLIAPSSPSSNEGKVVCRERLGGVLRHYYREAAWAESSSVARWITAVNPVCPCSHVIGADTLRTEQ